MDHEDLAAKKDEELLALYDTALRDSIMKIMGVHKDQSDPPNPLDPIRIRQEIILAKGELRHC